MAQEPMIRDRGARKSQVRSVIAGPMGYRGRVNKSLWECSLSRPVPCTNWMIVWGMLYVKKIRPMFFGCMDASNSFLTNLQVFRG